MTNIFQSIRLQCTERVGKEEQKYGREWVTRRRKERVAKLHKMWLYFLTYGVP